jgi:MATE family multidrug resistance protein
VAQASVTGRIVGQAWPVLFGQFSAVAYSVVDTILTGHASPADLAAMGVAAGVYGTVFMALMGVVIALNPIIAQHYGAGRHAAIGASVVQGLWVGLLVAVPGCLLLGFPELWLSSIAVPPDVGALVARYLRVLSFALPAALMFRALYALNVAVSRPKVVMVLQGTGLAVKVVLSAVLIFGAFGLPTLGAVGCAVATLIVHWLLFALAFAHTRVDGWYGRFRIHFAWPDARMVASQLRLGLPIGLAQALESASFALMALVIARLGTSITGGHQIVVNLAALSYQIPLAIAVATGTVTAQAIGAGDVSATRRTAAAGLRLGLAAAAATALTLWVLRAPIVALYTNDPAVAAVALSLMGYLVAFHVFDALQGVTAFVLRAHKIVAVPAVIFGVALWGVGFVGGYVVAFRPLFGAPRGAAGMWLMQALALFVTSLLLLGFYGLVLRRRLGLGIRGRGTLGVAELTVR